MEVSTMSVPRIFASRLAPFALILGLLACDERAPSSPSSENAAPAQLVAVEGGGEGPVGGALADSLAVRVTDRYGNPVPGVEIAWAAGNGGSVQPARSKTDAQGVARTQWVLGPIADAAQAASAALAGLPPVTFQATGTVRDMPLQLVRVGGDGQTGEVGTLLGDSLVVRVRTTNGAPVQGAVVAWRVLAGGGQISPATVRTDAQGHARAAWTLGASVGAGQASATLKHDTLLFTALATVGAPASVQVAAGNGQSATRGTILADSLVARVVDAYGNPVAGVAMRWSVVAGGGRLEHATSTTGADGTARTRWAMGFSPGQNTAAAAVDGAGTAGFTGTGLEGTLTLAAAADDPIWERAGINLYMVSTRVRASVADEGGRLTVGPPLIFAGGASPPEAPVGWDTIVVGGWNSDIFDRRYEDCAAEPAIVRFEDQEVEIEAGCPYSYPPPDEEAGDATP
jgi:hypothetical protein